MWNLIGEEKMIQKKATVVWLVIWLVIMSLATAFNAQTEATERLPDTIAGNRVAAYLKAFNSGDEQAMRRFFAENVSAASLAERPIDVRIGVYNEMRGNRGQLQLRRVTQATESAVTARFQTTKGGWVEIGFMFEPQPPHRFLGLRVDEVEAPADKTEDAAPVAMTETQVLALIQSRLDELVAADEFSGTVLLARGDKPIFHKAYGLAVRENNVPNRTDTKFNIGSINKTFTQMAVGQLVEEGKLSFDETLGRYLPDYPNRDAAAKVTIRHLLGMSSGIGDFFGPEFDAIAKSKLRTLKDYLPLFASKPLLFEPGTRQQYSNGGYIVLGLIIEKVSGQDYYDYVREHIFKPAGMQNADWYESDKPTPGMASGYTREGAGEGPRRNNIDSLPARGSSAGGGYATAEDLVKYSIALRAGKLRLPNFRGSPSTGTARSNFAGLGIAGGAPGVNAVLEVNPASGYTLIVMSNYDPPSAEQVAKQFRGWLAKIKN
jgi:CubicO group peptidase (beta-lactamase class C family)